MRSFASYNNASVHPRVMAAVAEANRDHAVGYGDDPWTRAAEEALRRTFGPTAAPFLVFNGTGANTIALQAVTRSWGSIVCAATAHVYVDECGAPARMTGCQLLPIETADGKLTPEMIAPHLHVMGVEHHPQPAVAYISQTTELGTIYTVEEVRALADFLHSHGMYLHMDGARLANACAALGCSLREMTVDAGVDVLSFGGTKNGMMMGETVVAFRPEIARDMRFIRKQSAQLASKMRYLGAQWVPYLSASDGGVSGGASGGVSEPAEPLWLENARHANAMAARLAEVLAARPEVRFTQRVESNQIFCILPPELLARLRERYFFYMWNDAAGEARFVTSWDTTEEDIAEFARILSR
ncbi:MAG: low specificity L-threonine aldolase [Alistipes sp.]|jgi:threonine aldolase|nr:low specificity L-threonine aldolase [Alistipes sp.]